MEKEKVTNEGKPLAKTMWRYAFFIALVLIGGYILLVGILLFPILLGDKAIGYKKVVDGKVIEEEIKVVGKERRDAALEAIKTITTVFGPWIAALVAFYFAGKQLEAVSEQLSEAQKTITATMKPDAKRILEGKLVKEVMESFDPKKHKIPQTAETELKAETIKDIVSHVEKLKDLKCFAVFKSSGEVEGIIKNPADIVEIKKDSSIGKKLEDLTTDMLRLVKAEPNQPLSEILPTLVNYEVLPVLEGKDIVGFVHRADVFKLMSGVS